jgi:topoisomerase IV subunit A
MHRCADGLLVRAGAPGYLAGMGKQLIPPQPSDVQEIALRDALEERYLAYALSTIMHRALPDARDGLKPVHRRILYGMRLLRLEPGTTFKKSAKIVGDVMGNFHPHGDQAIYDALVRLAQDFAARYPLVDGQGNFGNIDGDNPAAMRYTESRMTEVARLLLDGIDEDAVEFRPTYDGQSTEPSVLPGAFPNLLGNGSQGIAVGMATAIPPHNLHEICDAALFLIDNPNARARTLVKNYMPGPDFPTGGVIVDPRATIEEAYATGRGSFRVRARWKKEDTGRGTYLIVITEIPWLVQKTRLIERMAELFNDKKLPLVAEFRDESTEDVRIVIEPKSRAVDPGILMESLFKLTELESRIPLNMNVLSKGKVPKVMDLAEVLKEWLDHRREVLLRRSKNRLAQIEHRLEVLGGFLVAYLNIDKVIKIIRNEDEPKPVLIKTFKLSDVQADAILNMRLRNLRKLEEMEIKRENKDLRDEKSGLEKLIRSEKEQWKTVAEQIKEVREKFSKKTPLGKRRTDFAEAPEHDEAAIEEAMVVREPITVVVSEKGWIRALRGHQADLSGVTFKADDGLAFAFAAETTSKILAFATNGRFYTVDASKLPGGRGHGEPIRLYADIEQDGELVSVFRYQGGRKLLVASKTGRGFVVAEDECLANTRKGKQVLNVKPPDAARAVAPIEGELVAAVGENRKMVIFALDQVPEMTRGRGVRLQRHKDGGLSDVTTFKADGGLRWIGEGGRTSNLSIKELAAWRGNRGDAGRVRPDRFLANLKFGRPPETGNGKSGNDKNGGGNGT